MPGEPTEETCNDVDDDCNGEVDDIEPETCTTTPDECADREGFEVEGQTQCVDGGEICEVVSLNEDPENGTYCTSCGGPCGACGEGCGTVDFGLLECLPNLQCNVLEGEGTCQPLVGCEHRGEHVSCWLPEENQTCVDPSSG